MTAFDPKRSFGAAHQFGASALPLEWCGVAQFILISCLHVTKRQVD
jgi:hypothetical protein